VIRWCCYCQKLLGERPPLTSFDITHGVCRRCERRLAAGESLVPEFGTAIRFYRELFAAAREGDLGTCAAMARRGHAAGLGSTEMLVGLVQPALAEIGRHWERGEVGAVEEHRFTAWCTTMLALLERPRAPAGRLDILILLAPGNRHELGPRVAEHVLLASGIRALAIVPDLPSSDAVRLARDHDPVWIGFSCALPHMIERAREVATTVAEAGFHGRILLSGQALRRPVDAWSDLGAVVCATIDEAREAILAGRSAPPVSAS
jgi:methanogenic corrinoid protein MtbC1